jgi:hypothetical protein
VLTEQLVGRLKIPLKRSPGPMRKAAERDFLDLAQLEL